MSEMENNQLKCGDYFSFMHEGGDDQQINYWGPNKCYQAKFGEDFI